MEEAQYRKVLWQRKTLYNTTTFNECNGYSCNIWWLSALQTWLYWLPI